MTPNTHSNITTFTTMKICTNENVATLQCINYRTINTELPQCLLNSQFAYNYGKMLYKIINLRITEISATRFHSII